MEEIISDIPQVPTSLQQPVATIPAPQSPAKESMWSAFQNILTFISLGFFAGSLNLLWSLFINKWYPVATSSYYGDLIYTIIYYFIYYY